MMNTRAIARIGILAAGLGIGAAFASSPGIASADTADPFSFDLNDIAISFDGTSLFREGSATADSGTAGEFNFAFADGADASATATGGTGDIAEADGAGAEALATGGNYDTAIDIGSNTGDVEGAYAGTSYPVFEGVGNNDLALALGDNSTAGAGGVNFLGDHPGNDDVAAVFGTGSDATSGVGGNFDLAAAFGDNLDPAAIYANFVVDILPTVDGLDSALSTLLTDVGALF
jgi:hypothetical protein